MKQPLRLLAFDVGAESGRAIVGRFDGSVLTIDEAHRFLNLPVSLHGTVYWDFLRLYNDVTTGIRAALADGQVASLGVDTWGVDFGLLDGHGRLLGNPVHYRDSRTDGMVDRAVQSVSRANLYATTGIQVMSINTLYQLLALVQARDPDLERAERLLLMPDLIHFFLCGTAVAEYTNATTTQCLDASSRMWAHPVLDKLDIPTRLFPDIVPPGSCLGRLREDVANEVGSHVRIVAPGTHDTASAVAATPLSADGTTAFLSSGTWSLIGLEIDRPLLSVAAREANVSNEGGVAGSIRLLKNVMGLWLVQQARRGLGRDTSLPAYATLTSQAAAAQPFSAFIDPDDERFLRLEAAALPEAVRTFCSETSQSPPTDVGTLVRVIIESLALKYGVVLRQLEKLRGARVDTIHIVGGGSQNELLCQLTANATGRLVRAGPSEATAIGNLIVQAMALGELSSLADARNMVAASFPARQYEPADDWSEPRQRFDSILQSRRHTQGEVQ